MKKTTLVFTILLIINSTINTMDKKLSDKETSPIFGSKDGKYPSPRAGRRMSVPLSPTDRQKKINILVEESKQNQAALKDTFNYDTTDSFKTNTKLIASAAGLSACWSSRIQEEDLK